MRVLGPQDYARTRWKNDGGWTTEIARNPGASGAEFDWRISIADIESDGVFSVFEHVDRELVLLSGDGIELVIDANAAVRLSERFERIRFRGESHVDCRLLDGATRDFNVMTRRDHFSAEVFARPLVGPMLLFPQPEVIWLAHVFAGAARARRGAESLPVESGETLIIDTPASSQRVVLDGGGELILVKLTPRARAEMPT